ncbi:MAG: hypothetical protein ACJZ00_07860 [Cytophagales bacterium]|nr:MAG: hypothetical protein CND58_03870 [Rhodothermaeota bacterium MED-G16]
MRYFFLLIFFIFSCNSSNQTDITEQEVKDKFDEFFGVLSVNNPDKNKLYELVTDDYFIFENQKKYSMEEFIEFVSTFKTLEDNWELSDFEIDIDKNSAHASLRNVGKFLVETDSGNVIMNFDWLESAYLIREGGELKFDFYFSDAIKESVTKVD